MKKMSIVINGQHEEEIGLEILQGIYAAIQNHGYTDVSVQAEELAELQEKVGQMSEEELKAFRNSMNPDDMGFFGEESVDDDSTKD